MLHMESPQQTIYAPLNQLMTDSESEEEIHNATKHKGQQQFFQQNGNLNPSKLQFNSNVTDYSVGNTQIPSTYTTNMQNTFRSVRMSDIGLNDQGSNLSSFTSDYDERNHVDADNVAILGSSNSTKDLSNESMSPARRCCFVASLILCVFAVFGFVWLVPCGTDTCPTVLDQIKTHNWLNNYTKIELKGGVNVVNGLRSWENNLIFLYRGDVFFPEFPVSNTRRNGIISLIGSSGAVAWYDEMVDEPIAIDCTLLDVDNNGRPDCLVIDEYGELGAINPISGQWHWRYKERFAQKIDTIDFPVILPDLDGDGVLEILIVASGELEHRTKSHVLRGDLKPGRGEERNFLRILSGRHGKPIGDGFKMHDCDALQKLQLENAQSVTFSCVQNNTESQRSKTLGELFALITNKSVVDQKFVPASKIAQHRGHYGQRRDIDAQRNIYSLSGRELVVENRGKCPEDCNVTFILCDTRNNKTKVLRNYTSSNMYGMIPAQWHFKNVNNEMSGFVMKFWKWANNKNSHHTFRSNGANYSNNYRNTYPTKKSKVNALKENTLKATQKNNIESNKTKKSRRRRRRKRQVKHEFPSMEFNAFDNFVQKRQTFSLPLKKESPEGETRIKRRVSANATRQKTGSSLLMDNYKMQMITETVILVLFIGADTRIENTSQSNIIQFCRNDRNNDVAICQPALNNQENSMLIADLDQDGSQELVSYMSTFVQASDDTQDWNLVTYVRLLRLQSDFIYDEEKHD